MAIKCAALGSATVKRIIRFNVKRSADGYISNSNHIIIFHFITFSLGVRYTNLFCAPHSLSLTVHLYVSKSKRWYSFSYQRIRQWSKLFFSDLKQAFKYSVNKFFHRFFVLGIKFKLQKWCCPVLQNVSESHRFECFYRWDVDVWMWIVAVSFSTINCVFQVACLCKWIQCAKEKNTTLFMVAFNF